MKNKTILLVLLFALLISACGGEKTATPAAVATAPAVSVDATATLDPCSEAGLPGEVEKVNDLMREFDDYSRLASSTPQDKLVQVIPPLQAIRRRAESQRAPECLVELKKYQLAHMNTVIEILMAFMANAQSESVNQGIEQARDLHMKYDVEIARLLGLTFVAPPTGLAPIPTVDPNATVPPAALTKPAGLSVLNPGPNEVTLLSAPDAAAGGVATLPAGAVTPAFGVTADKMWFQVEVPGNPGQKAWVSTSQVQISGEPPIVTP